MSLQPVAGRAGRGSASATSSDGRAPRPGAALGLPRIRRLRKRTEFQAVYHGGVRLGCRLFTLFALATRSVLPGRVGLTVTRKIGNAVTRNRCKRLLREAMRRHWSLLPAGVDLVLHARHGLEAASAGEVERQLVRMLQRAARRLR